MASEKEKFLISEKTESVRLDGLVCQKSDFLENLLLVLVKSKAGFLFFYFYISLFLKNRLDFRIFLKVLVSKRF